MPGALGRPGERGPLGEPGPRGQVGPQGTVYIATNATELHEKTKQLLCFVFSKMLYLTHQSVLNVVINSACYFKIF